MQSITQIATEAIQYAHLRWAIVPLHGLTPEGHCDCKAGPNCTCPGKHPHQIGWDKLPPATPQMLELLMQAYPGCNIGVQLGPKSGVVDVEFDSQEGEATAQRLLTEHLQTPTYRSSRSLHRLYRPPEGLGPQPAFSDSAGARGPLGSRQGGSVGAAAV